jgi:hypothetical protein
MTSGRPRRRSTVDALIDDSALPHEHRELVRRLLRQARLPATTTIDVAEELIWHFEDGLARGVTPGALVTSFGIVDRSAELIRRAQDRRRRAEPWRQAMLLAVGGLVASTLTAYVSSAVVLHSAEPLVATARGTTGQLEEPAWGHGASTARAVRDRTHQRLRTASPEARRRAIVANLDEAAALRREASLEAELAAIDIIHDAITALGGTDTRPDIDAALRRALGPDHMLLRGSTIRAAYRDLLDRVYSGDDGNARVTASGLRVLQALRGKMHPTVAALLLEPAYFVLPARRWAVEREIDAIAADVEAAGSASPNGAVERLLARQAELERDPIRALRYFPIAATVPRLASAASRVLIVSRAAAHAARTTQPAVSPIRSDRGI